MEFHEKLQELRKSRGLTQEELAQDLYVSRTAISKWESGRGYPNIDSLKELSAYFSVSIDDLLSGEKLLSLAERENRSNLQSMRHLLSGMADIGSFLLILLPLYPNTLDGFVYSVNLLHYTQVTPLQRLLYWFLYLALILTGIVRILYTKLKTKKVPHLVTGLSMVLSSLAIVSLAVAREPYAILVTFAFFVVKVILARHT